MNICYICNEYPPHNNGGIGTYTKEIAERLSFFGHNVSVIGVYSDVNVKTVEVINGVDLIRLPKSKFSLLKDRFNLLNEVDYLDKSSKLDVVECQEYGGLLAFWPSKSYSVIIRLHGSIAYFRNEFNEYFLKDIVWKFLEKKTLLKGDKIVSVSNYTGKKTSKIFNINKKIVTIYNGVKIPEKYKKDYSINDSFSVIYAGSLLTKKGFIQLLKSWEIVHKEIPNAKLYIAGKNNNNQLDKINDFNIDPNCISYLGILTKDELEDLYCTVDLAVFPSFVEAFSLAPMEAMAIGLPVIYTTCCSGSELITSDVNGWLVDPKDENSIAQHILRVNYMTSNMRESIGMSARSHIMNNFSIDKVALDNEEMMTELVESKKRAV